MIPGAWQLPPEDGKQLPEEFPDIWQQPLTAVCCPVCYSDDVMVRVNIRPRSSTYWEFRCRSCEHQGLATMVTRNGKRTIKPMEEHLMMRHVIEIIVGEIPAPRGIDITGVTLHGVIVARWAEATPPEPVEIIDTYAGAVTPIEVFTEFPVLPAAYRRSPW